MPIPWLTEEAVWVPQWPLSSEKLQAAKQLVEEQVQLGHLEPTQSPWNTPIFVIKKKSGKWRLLHDLRAINAQMKIMGPVQRGLPLLSTLPKHWPIIIIDIKDCFFSIPLHPKDRVRFAFTLPTVNHTSPDLRYQWKVLPQGMANSPTMCQLFVNQALTPAREKYPNVIMCHYMDDVLLCTKQSEMVEKVYVEVIAYLARAGLVIATEKVQKSDVGKFLGAVITPDIIQPQKVQIRRDSLQTLNDFQKLLGDITWIRPYLHVPTAELKPLYDILEGETHISSPRILTKEAATALKKVEKAITQAQLARWDPQIPIDLCILKTRLLPTAVLWQSGPLLWVHPQASPAKTVEYYPTAVAELASKGIKMAVTHFGIYPKRLIVPYTAAQVQVLSATIDDWAILRCSFDGLIDNHYPKNPLLQFYTAHPIIFPKVTSARPLPDGLDVYTDGSKTGLGAYVVNNKTVTIQCSPDSPQLVECQVVLEVLKRFSTPLNIISDSNYVVNAVSRLEAAGLIKASSKVAHLFRDIQAQLLNRHHPFFITHIRAHTSLPGPMVTGNMLADLATRSATYVVLDSVAAAKEFHSTFHVPAETLRLKFHITRAEAREIVLQCSSCAEFLPTPHVGINPRGLHPLQIWQMDVTHVSSFGKLQFIHVSIDTCSGIISATPLTGEKAAHVIQHCLEAWSAWGIPKVIKTDNGPAYTSNKFAQFCARMGVSHVTGLPYNPQGQGMIERAHRTLKHYISKQKGGIEGMTCSPRALLSTTLLTLNFLVLDAHGRSAADRHGHWPKPPLEMAKWKNVLTNKWQGPDPVLTRSRGAVCVFPQNEDNPIWVPTRLTRIVKEAEDDQCTPKDGNLDMHLGSTDLAPDSNDSRAKMGHPVGLPETNADMP